MMPNQRVTDNEHVILLAEFDVLVGGAEVVFIGFWVNCFPLQDVLGSGAIELRFDERGFLLIFLSELRRIERGTDHKAAAISILKRGMLGAGSP